MPKSIQDEFTHLPLSRQRKYQLRRQGESRCTECGAPVIYGSRCLKHLVKARERKRKKEGLKRRYLHSLSYRLREGLVVPTVSALQPPVPGARADDAKPAKAPRKPRTRKR